MAMAQRKEANNDLEKAQHNAGVQQAVFDHILSLPALEGGGDKRVPAMRMLLQRFGMPKRDVRKHRAQCIADIFKRAKLTAKPPGVAPPAAAAP
eukprot:5071959-Prymnesium_polylepis.1